MHGSEGTHPLVVVALDPSDEAQHREDLRLYLKGDVEFLDNVVHAQGHAGPGPEHHHGGLEADGVVAAVVDDDLGDELDGPAHGAQRAEHVCGCRNVHNSLKCLGVDDEG
jgi:hypothetical protein